MEQVPAQSSRWKWWYLAVVPALTIISTVAGSAVTYAIANSGLQKQNSDLQKQVERFEERDLAREKTAAAFVEEMRAKDLARDQREAQRVEDHKKVQDQLRHAEARADRQKQLVAETEQLLRVELHKALYYIDPANDLAAERARARIALSIKAQESSDKNKYGEQVAKELWGRAAHDAAPLPPTIRETVQSEPPSIREK